MNKNAIKKFAIEARKKLIDSVTDKAGMLGITEKSCSEPITKGTDFEVYQTVAGTEVTLNKRQCEQRRRLVSQIESRGFEEVVEEVAYTWFNRICAIRFMEVNDYLPNRVRVLSSEKKGKMEPDLVTQAPDVDLDLSVQEKEEIINWKMSGTSVDTDKLYCKLFLKQCHQLHDILPGLFEADFDYMELLFGISYTNKDDVIYMLVNSETGIPEDDFNVSTLDEEGNPTGQVEIIGWLYQYYNTELKDDTFAKLKKNVKITKEKIPAATQLFTPDWIVRYMVENSVGRIWIEHLRAVDSSTDEKETAERFGWKYYLPEAEQEDSVNVKLATIRTTYKDLKPTDITCIDPCMGSGHILIAMFDVLMDIYESAGYDKREAVFEIVEHNIHGLDIDQRAYQLAYFAVMIKARTYNRRYFYGIQERNITTNIFCIAESNNINSKHVEYLIRHNPEMGEVSENIKELLHSLLDATEYGSLVNVPMLDWERIEKILSVDVKIEQINFETLGIEETKRKLKNLISVGKLLAGQYLVVSTNPPYKGKSDLNKKLAEYIESYYVAGDIEKLPFRELQEPSKLIKLVQECIDICRSDWDERETSWDFKIHPYVQIYRNNPGITVSEVADRYSEYKRNQMDLLYNHEKIINEIFIEDYGLQDEVSSEIEEKDNSIKMRNQDEMVKSLLSYIVGCIFGRYSIKQKSIYIAGDKFEKTFEDYMDEDNIIPITQEEYFEDDIVNNICDMIRIIFGENNYEDNLLYISSRLKGASGNAREILRNYFMKDFYKDHCAMYNKLPIYWMFSSGKENAFKALVYIHRMNENTVKQLRTEYLHKTQNAIESVLKSLEYELEAYEKVSGKAIKTKQINRYKKQLSEIRQYDEAIAHIANNEKKIQLERGIKENYKNYQGVQVKKEGQRTLDIDLLERI